MSKKNSRRLKKVKNKELKVEDLINVLNMVEIVCDIYGSDTFENDMDFLSKTIKIEYGKVIPLRLLSAAYSRYNSLPF